tara:strand:+ start:73 stop:855 length:783 start_codon:yes stop_codon:yes gene_type:complete
MKKINFDVISLYPKVFESLNNMGVISRAIRNNLISINLHDLRDFGEGNYKQVDDEPYGGGSGMVLKPEPIYNSYESIQKVSKCLTLLMTPQGKVLKQSDFIKWINYDQIILICGQYEGFDERVRILADEEISAGDYVLTGGEIPSISIINGITRLIPGTLGDPQSLEDESHNYGLLEYPQYTRPSIFRGMQVPDILLSGNHKEIKYWRKEQMIKRTIKRRNDLISQEKCNNSQENKIMNGVFKNEMKFPSVNEYDNYPDW